MSIINKGVYDAGKMFILQTGNDWPTAEVSISFNGYDSEIHVSQLDGNDTTGNGDLLNPVATITKALTLVTAGVRRTIVIHPGTYNESPSITVQATVLNSFSPLGGTTSIVGTLSSNVGFTVAGIQISNLNITTPSGTGDPHVIDCTITGTLTKSGSATYTEIQHCDINTACNITGTGLVNIVNPNLNFLTVNNAGAVVTVRAAKSCVAPVLTAGTLSIVDSAVQAYSSNALTTSAGTVVNIANSQFLNSTSNNVARVVLTGFYSILNCVYDKPNSTLVPLSASGGSTNSIDYFQYINADSLTISGGGNITGANLVVANTFVSSGFGVPTLSSATSINLTANASNGGAVVIQNSPLRLRSYTTVDRGNITAATGDLIYNSTTLTNQSFNGTTWANVSLPAPAPPDFNPISFMLAGM
jgi:hypothetical protein